MNRTVLGVSLIGLGTASTLGGGWLLTHEPEVAVAPTAAAAAVPPAPTAVATTAPETTAIAEPVPQAAAPISSAPARAASSATMARPRAPTPVRVPDVSAAAPPAPEGPACADPRAPSVQAATAGYPRAFRVCPFDAATSESQAWVQLRPDAWTLQVGTRATLSFRFVEKQAMVLDPPAPPREVVGSVVTDGSTMYFIPDRVAGGPPRLLLVRQLVGGSQADAPRATWRQVGTIHERR